MMSRLRQIFGKSVPVQEVTTDKTFKRLSVAPGDGAWVRQTSSKIVGPLERATLETTNEFKLNEAGESLDFLYQEKGATNSRNASLNEAEDENTVRNFFHHFDYSS